MTIMNDRENNKTIDTETGMYLTLVDEHSYSGHRGLELHDGDTVLYIAITKKRPIKNEDGVYIYPTEDGVSIKSYSVDLVSIRSEHRVITRPEYEHYKPIIEKFLIGYQEYHGMISGVKMKFQISFSVFEKSLAKREAADV